LLTSALLAAAFAGLVAVGVSVAIERLGGRLGGLVGTLPTTIVPASIGIWFEAGEPALFQAAMDTVPGGMLVNALFLLMWRVVPPRLPAMSLMRALTLMTAVSITLWFVLALGFVRFAEGWSDGANPTWPLAVAGLVLLLGLGVAACLRAPPTPKGTNRVPRVTLVLRGIFAATAIGVTVWVATVAPLLAGVVAVFPAIFWTAMASTWLAQGHKVPAGAAGPMMLGSSSVAVYALLAHWLFPAVGPVAGAALAWTLAVVTTTVPAWWWLSGRTSHAPTP
jgi:hypothetical protein